MYYEYVCTQCEAEIIMTTETKHVRCPDCLEWTAEPKILVETV